MRWSNSFIPTLRDDPADAEAISHKLLLRAGFMRQLMSGAYSILPLGHRVCQKITGIIREEMNQIGGQEFELPALHPAEIWQKSGRWETMGEEMFRLQDRRGSDLALGMTHEEIFADLAREVRSYKQLPQIWYQFQKKFRDEPRPKSGVLRVREFTMKDAYSLDQNQAGLDHSFQQHFDAYRRIFSRCGLDALAVEASSGSMGGSESIEFMVGSEAGEDFIATCASCGYAANVEKATSRLSEIQDDPGPDQPEKFATPDQKTIEEIATMEGGAPAESQIKTLIYMVDGSPVMVLLRGDHILSEQKLLDGFGANEVRPAHETEIRDLLGAGAGSLGAVGVEEKTIVIDEALRNRNNLVTGANEDGFHLRGVSVERDLSNLQWADLREVQQGESCSLCGSELAVLKSIEVGHIFKLGTRYSEAMGAQFLDENGKSIPIIMGSYGIGVERLMASVVETHFDGNGIIWPMSVAPYEVVISMVKPRETEVAEVAERIYEGLTSAGVDVLLDDRDERPGVKFKDADLIGIPGRITVGPKGLQEGKVEWVRRGAEEKRDLEIDHAVVIVTEFVAEERR